ncbi:MAG TPA: gamma-glutamyl-gamma-aminobutyrate hydrolase family protein [Segeticoccus sp.]|uniref:gamma-glutamyl-gamma-aminobutyrate hydrolase family protein n=1 Tax=Segeticoccus sp. TaxID=2706531 RepID=UPI002D7FD3AF|nr:gamma-glutamyl-gamma-aminobutyrate hydrolase family protein [Segeticoccus sp.]HET8600962.1 gamma-glutamyl-gamma-aminobutyrate hydrolase family protein [Segeticoccus sp.]
MPGERPLIGIAPRFLKGEDGKLADAAARLTVLECLAAVGCQPVMLYVVDPDDPDEVAAVVRSVAGLVFPGGGDSDPALYGQPDRHPALRLVDPRQDASDLALIRAAVAAGVPTLAICRGMQTLNIAQDGSLIQHLEPGSVAHWEHAHRIRVSEPDSRVARMYPDGELTGCSYHQQAVDRLGADLHVTALADDGCIEAVEHLHAPVLGLQWHPEVTLPEVPERQFAPFAWLAREAARQPVA